MELDAVLSGALSRWAGGVHRHPIATIAACALLTLASLAMAALWLGMNSNTLELFPEDLPARRNHDASVTAALRISQR